MEEGHRDHSRTSRDVVLKSVVPGFTVAGSLSVCILEFGKLGSYRVRRSLCKRTLSA